MTEDDSDFDCRKRFEERYVDLPLFFRRGDIVHIAGTDLIGIAWGPADDAEEEQYRKKCHASEIIRIFRLALI